jgi:hypothetical protein
MIGRGREDALFYQGMNNDLVIISDGRVTDFCSQKFTSRVDAPFRKFRHNKNFPDRPVLPVSTSLLESMDSTSRPEHSRLGEAESYT